MCIEDVVVMSSCLGIMLPILITFLVDGAAQNAVVFQAFGIASRHLMCESGVANSPLTYTQTFLAGGRKHSCYLYAWQVYALRLALHSQLLRRATSNDLVSYIMTFMFHCLQAWRRVWCRRSSWRRWRCSKSASSFRQPCMETLHTLGPCTCYAGSSVLKA